MLGIPRFKVHLRFVINSQALLLRMTSLAKKRCDAELSQIKENFKFIKSKGLFLAGPQKTFKYPRNKNAGELGYKETAVLFLVGSEPETQGLQVLLTKRSTTVGTFKGAKNLVNSQSSKFMQGKHVCLEVLERAKMLP